jgi:hypothetical protein
MCFFLIIFIHKQADAQMRVGYPQRFRLTGLIELHYTDNSIKTSYDGRETKGGWSRFEQHYEVGIEGYIYHPRLAIFSTGITFTNAITSNQKNTRSNNIGYNLSATFLPYRPVTLNIYAMRSDYTIKGLTAIPEEGSINQYGARLNVNTRILPTMRLDYSHFDTELKNSSNVPVKMKTDSWSFSIHGSLRSFNTLYGLNLGFTDFSSTNISYNAKYINIGTSTSIGKVGTLSNSFLYSDDESSKSLRFDSYLHFRPGRRLIHNYRYDYSNTEYYFKGSEAAGTEDRTVTRVLHMLTGTWSYRFTDRLSGALSLFYSRRNEAENKKNEERYTSYGISPGLSYRRPVAGFEFSSYYRFFLTDDEKRGKLKEHDLELNLQTNKIRWGTVYANYYLFISDEIDKYLETSDEFIEEGVVKEIKIKTTVHTLRIGIRGKGLRLGSRWGSSRAYWNIESEYLHSRTNGERPKNCDMMSEDYYECLEGLISEIEKWSKKTDQYTLDGYLMYPLARGTVNLKTRYSTGEADSKKIKRFLYDVRFNYPVSRRLSFSIWWRQMWDKIEGSFDRKIRDYELLADYRIGRLFLSLEYQVSRQEESNAVTENRRFFVRLRRPI